MLQASETANSIQDEGFYIPMSDSYKDSITDYLDKHTLV